MNKLSKDDWKMGYIVISTALLIFLCNCIFYCLAFGTPIEIYWFLFPLPMYFLFKTINRFAHPKCLKDISLEIVVVIAAILMLIYVKCVAVRFNINAHIDWLSFVISLNFLLSLKVNVDKTKEAPLPTVSEDKLSKDLFNIFYLNTSKAHEIAMCFSERP